MTAQKSNRRPAEFWIELFLIGLAGVLVAWPLRGHFIKPHIDFFDFNDAADALLTSPLESSHKRGPVYPALLAIGGGIVRACGVVDPPPRQVFAEWFNAGLLPVNAMLVYLLGRRWLANDERSRFVLAPWIAIAFLVMPLGLSMSAHLLVEPLLVAVILLTILAADARRSGLAYALAALAILTRYDVAGLLAGLIAADFLSGRRRMVMICGGVALLPLGVWLAFTALNWRHELDQHYLQQMADRPQFDLSWSLRVMLDSCFSPGRIPLPAWVDLDEGLLRGAFRIGLGLLASLGVWRIARLRSRSASAALGGAIGYVLVHAAFPFRWERFGYPLAPLLLIAAGIGAAWVVEYCRASQKTAWNRPLARAVGVIAASIVGLILIVGVVQSIADAAAGGRASWFLLLLRRCVPVFAILLTLAAVRKDWTAVAVGALAVCGFVPLQLREADPVLGTGQEREGLVRAARWIAANCGPDQIVLSDQVGLLRLYAPDRRRNFLAYWQIEADVWPDIITECRRGGVRMIMWHSAVYEEHAHEMYAGWWRVERFAALDGSTLPAGLRLVQTFEGNPTVTILAVTDP